MAPSKREHARTVTSLHVQVSLVERARTNQVLFRGLAQAKDVTIAGLKLSLMPLPDAVMQAIENQQVLALLTVHISPRDVVELSATAKWAKGTPDASFVGLSYAGGNIAAQQRVLDWSQRDAEVLARRSRRLLVAVSVLAALLLVQTLRFFFTAGTPERRVAERIPGANGTAARSDQGDGERGDAAAVAARRNVERGEERRPWKLKELSPHEKQRLAQHFAQPRDDKWAEPSEKLFSRDLAKHIAGLQPLQQKAWGIAFDSIECRRTSCLAKMRANGYGQWLAYFEQSVYKQGVLDPGRLDFDMKCLPIAIDQDVEGAVPATMPGYEASILFDCAKPQYVPLPPPPDASRDRLLNPELHAQLPEKIRNDLDANVARAQEKFKRQQQILAEEKARREDPNFFRVEPRSAK